VEGVVWVHRESLWNCNGALCQIALEGGQVQEGSVGVTKKFWGAMAA